MTETVFAAKALSKKYGSLSALNGLNMEIKKGDIYGFVGENGAGKTTLIRILAGMAFKTNGAMSLFGVSDERQMPKQRHKIGGVIEAPAVYSDLSAAENLEIVRLQRGIPGKACIQEALETVSLTDTGKKKAKDFSLGMKQRLGLAMALIGEPEFLVLDEPTNGLDPAGIVEFRELIRKLNRERGITMLISSHILGELYQLATCYGFIHKGELVEQITLEQLDEKCRRHVYIRVSDAPKAATIIETMLNTTNFEVVPANTIKLYDYLENSDVVANALFKEGVSVLEITCKGDDLEQYYLNLIGGQQ